MKLVKDKQILVAADFAGLALKDAVVQHLKERGWTVTDVGMKADDTGTPEMYHRIGLRAGAMIAEGEFERALLLRNWNGYPYCGEQVPACPCSRLRDGPSRAALRDGQQLQCSCDGWILCCPAHRHGDGRRISGA